MQTKSTAVLAVLDFWRRGWDSNPRYVAAHLISSQTPSTTRTPLHILLRRCSLFASVFIIILFNFAFAKSGF